MNTKIDAKDRDEKELQHQQQRLLEQQEEQERQLRLERLLDDVEELAIEFREAPEQIGHFVAELDATGRLTESDLERVIARLVEVGGPELAERAFGLEGARLAGLGSLAEVSLDWAEASERLTARRGVVDADEERAARTIALLEKISHFLGLSSADVTVRSDAEAARRTEARGAQGLAEEGVVYLHPDAYQPETQAGRALLGHEVVHVAQRAERNANVGATPYKRGAEAEASVLGDAFAAGQSIGRPKHVLPAMDVAADTDAAADQSQQAGPPDDFRVTLGGRRFRLQIPDNGTPGRVNIDNINVSVHGVTMTSATLNFDDAWNFERGTLTGSMQVGDAISIDNLELRIDGDKNVQASVTGVEINIGSYINATMDLSIGAEGVSGSATVDAGAVRLSEDVSFTGGSLSLTLSPDGGLAASGELTAALAGVGAMTFSASITDGQGAGRGGGGRADQTAQRELPGQDSDGGGAAVTGTVTIQLDEGLQIIDGLTLQGASITGSYSEAEGFRTNGRVQVGVREWATADVEVGYKHTGGLWSVNGTITQSEDAPLTLGEGPNALVLSGGSLEVAYNDNVLESVTASGTFTHEHFECQITEATYDIPGHEFSGDVTVRNTHPFQLGEGPTAITVEEAEGTATFVANALDTLTLNRAVAKIPYEEQETFQVTVTEASYKMSEKQLSGTGSVQTLRELTFGAVTSWHVVIAQGSEATVTVENNRVAAFNSGIAIQINRAEALIAAGTLSLDFTNEGEAGGGVTGSGTFTLDGDVELPPMGDYMLTLKAGSAAGINVANSQAESASLENFKVWVDHATLPAKVEVLVNGTLDFESGKITGTGEASLREAWPFEVTWGAFQLDAGGTLSAEVTDSELVKVDGDFPMTATVNAGERTFEIEGGVSGGWTKESGQVTADVTATLKNEQSFDINGGTDNIKVLPDVTTIGGHIEGGTLESVSLDLGLEYRHRGEHWLSGQISEGTLNLQSGLVSFEGELNLIKRVEQPLDDAGRWKIVIPENTAKVNCTVNEGNLDRLGGEIVLELHEGDEVLLRGSLKDANLDLTEEQPKFSGQFDLKVCTAYDFPRGEVGQLPPRVQLTVLENSSVGGTVTDNALTDATVQLLFGVKLDGAEVGTGEVEGSWNAKDNVVGGHGHFQLTTDVVVDPSASSSADEPAGWTLLLKNGARVDIDVVENSLASASVNVETVLRKGEEEVATGHIEGDYMFGDEAGFTGTASFDMSKDFKLGTVGRYDIYLGDDTGVTGRAENSRIVAASGDFVLVAKNVGEEDAAMKLTVNTNYQEGQGLSGSATIEVCKEIRIGQAEPYSVWIDPSTQGTVTVANNEPQAFDGTLTFLVKKGDEPAFARASAVIAYDFRQGESATVDFDGTIELIGDLEIGEAAGFKFTMKPGTNLHAVLQGNDLQQIDGQMVLSIDQAAETEVATLNINATYDATQEQPLFTGEANLQVHKRVDLGYEAFGYHFYLRESGISVSLVNSDITAASGSIVFEADQQGGTEEAPLGSLVVAFGGSYERAPGAATGNFSGRGTCTVEGQLHVGDAGDYAFFVEGGSGIEIHVDNNEFTYLKGALTARVDQTSPGAGEDVQFLRLACEVEYIPADGGTINANGSAAMLGSKKILEMAGYQFWLVAGQGGNVATVDIKDNVLNEVGGTVSCAVYDDPTKGPLIRAHAQGSWKRETNLFSGSGDIRLGRDVTFPENAGEGQARIIFREGSGGNAEVKNNEIRKLGGDLSVTICDAQGPVVSVTANGTYNAVTNVLEELTGTATLERAIEIGGTGDNAIFRIDSLTGTATIRNNELVGVEGALDFTVPPLNGMTGHLEGGWRIKEDGTDEYWGTGTINFTLFDDPDKGRSMSGEISATFNRDGTWSISGDAEYHLSPIIGGDVHVEMDQNLDPVIDVGFSLTNLPLMDSRELFAKELDLLPRQDIMIFPPAALNLFFGAKAGVKLDMRALLFSAEIRADGWRPRAQAGEVGAVPQFTAEMSMNWGLDFQATLAAYLGISLGATGFSVGAGLEGQLEITVPLVVNPYGMLTGGPEGFGGELGIGVTIAPSLKVRGIPFVSAVLGPLDFRHDMAVFEQDLGELFRWEWGTKYKFGDVQGEEPYDASQNTATSGREAPITGGTENQEPSFPTRQPAAPPRREGTPDIAADPGQSQEEQSGPMGEMQQHIDDITAIGEGIGAIGMLFGLLANLLTGLAVAGPAGLIIMLIIEIIFNDLTWDSLVEAVRAVGRAMVVAARLLRPYLPDWLNGIIDFASGAKPSLMDALFGADDKVRAEVDRGTHRELPPEGRAKFCDIMMDGSCGNADEDRILVILHYSDRKGDLRQVLSHIGGGVDRLDWKLDWSQNDELWELLEKYGYSD